MVAGEENLIPMSERSKDEVREIGRKGGIASGESRRRRKQLQEQADFLFSLPMSDNIKKKDEKGEVKSLLEEFKTISGVEDIDNQMSVLIALLKQAQNGNVYACNAIFELLGEKKTNINLDGGVTVNFNGENDIED